jgi:hypothetical protein
MNRIPERRRPLFVLAASLAVLLVVAGGVLLIGQLAPTPSPTAVPTSSATVSPSADESTAEGAVRAFFAALKDARQTDDPALIRPFVTGEQSSAYLSVQGFLLGQKAVKKASVLTVQQLENISVQTTGDSATVQLVYTEGGYDISLDSGDPLESLGVLAPRDVTLELRRVDGHWLVETYEAQPR